MADEDITGVPATSETVPGSDTAGSAPLEVGSTPLDVLNSELILAAGDGLGEAPKEGPQDEIQSVEIGTLNPDVIVRRASASTLTHDGTPAGNFNAAAATVPMVKTYLETVPEVNAFLCPGLSKIWIVGTASDLTNLSNDRLAKELEKSQMTEAVRKQVVVDAQNYRGRASYFTTRSSNCSTDCAIVIAGHPGKQFIPDDSVWAEKEFFQDRARERVALHELMHAARHTSCPFKDSTYLNEGATTFFEQRAYKHVTEEGTAITANHAHLRDLFSAYYQQASNTIALLAGSVPQGETLIAQAYFGGLPYFEAVFNAWFTKANDTQIGSNPRTPWQQFLDRVEPADEQVHGDGKGPTNEMSSIDTWVSQYGPDPSE